MLAGIDGLQDLTLTTNGSLLAATGAHASRRRPPARHRQPRLAGRRVFKAMNDVDFPVASVLEASTRRPRRGLRPIKVDMVVKRGVNEHEIVDMARHFRGSGHILRFIEYMDVGTTNGWRLDDVVPAAEIVRTIDAVWPLEPVEPNYRGEVARALPLHGTASGEIGVIASVTQPFCGDCTRARLSADGKLYTCLFADAGHDLRALLRGGATDEEIAQARSRAIWTRRDRPLLELRTRGHHPLRKVEMSRIGG